jgi:hypothetical protein
LGGRAATTKLNCNAGVHDEMHSPFFTRDAPAPVGPRTHSTTAVVAW